jgi:Flp pilus assembly protein TadD
MTLPELMSAGRQALTDRKWAEAQSFFEDAVNVAPRDPAARAGLARARRYAESPQKSLEALAEALEQDVADAEVFFQLACSRAAMGRKNEALAALREALRRGLTDPARIGYEADLAGLAGEPEFRSLTAARSGA